jgi:hypothetical protein
MRSNDVQRKPSPILTLNAVAQAVIKQSGKLCLANY